jgi:hypothetical protein
VTKLQRKVFRASLAQPEAFHRRRGQAAFSPWNGKKLAAAEIDERLMASGIGALRDHCCFAPFVPQTKVTQSHGLVCVTIVTVCCDPGKASRRAVIFVTCAGAGGRYD